MQHNQPERTPISLLQEVFPADTNPYGTAFGGNIMALMDVAAGMAASRFAHCQFVTGAMDAVRFVAPAREGDIVEVVARVVYTSAHTCGVKLQVNAMGKTRWEPRSCCQGTILMVAIDEHGKPVRIRQFEPENDAERLEWDEVADVHRRMVEDRRKIRRGKKA